MMKTGRLIKELRIKKGLTQEELAEKTELSARTIQRIENGEVDPRAYTLQMIAKALEVDYGLFVEADSEEDKELEETKDRQWLALMHLSGLFLLFIPSVLFWNQRKDEMKECSAHFKDILWFQLSYWLLFILPGLFVLGMPSGIFPGLFLGGAMTMINAIKVLNGNPYKYILTIHFREVNGKTKLTFK